MKILRGGRSRPVASFLRLSSRPKAFISEFICESAHRRQDQMQALLMPGALRNLSSEITKSTRESDGRGAKMCQIPVQLVSKNPDSPRYTRRHGPTLGTVPVACIAVLRHTHRTNGYKTIILQRRKRSPTRHRRVACKGEDDLEISGLRVRCPRLSWPCCRPSFKGLAVDVDDGFKPTYELTDRGRQVVKEFAPPSKKHQSSISQPTKTARVKPFHGTYSNT